MPTPTLTPLTHLRLAHEEIVAKVLDGEAIIIDLSKGAYYTSEKTGGLIWGLIEGGRCVADIAAEIAARYDVSPARACDDVMHIAAALVDAGVLVGVEGERAAPSTSPVDSQEKLPYEPPRLRAFYDMEELLALDPPSPSFTDIAWKE